MKINKFDVLLENLGQAFRKARLRQNLTQEELGIKANRGQSAIGKLERGPVAGVPLQVLYEVAEAIPISLSELFAIAEKQGVNQSIDLYQETIEELIPQINKLSTAKKRSIERILSEILFLSPNQKKDS